MKLKADLWRGVSSGWGQIEQKTHQILTWVEQWTNENGDEEEEKKGSEDAYSAATAFGGDSETKGYEVEDENQDKDKLGSHKSGALLLCFLMNKEWGSREEKRERVEMECTSQ